MSVEHNNNSYYLNTLTIDQLYTVASVENCHNWWAVKSRSGLIDLIRQCRRIRYPGYDEVDYVKK